MNLVLDATNLNSAILWTRANAEGHPTIMAGGLKDDRALPHFPDGMSLAAGSGGMRFWRSLQERQGILRVLKIWYQVIRRPARIALDAGIPDDRLVELEDHWTDQ
jgi:hypothetical protein